MGNVTDQSPGVQLATIQKLARSPVGLATFMLDHDPRSLDLIARAFGGHVGAAKPPFTRDSRGLQVTAQIGASNHYLK